MFSIVVRVQGQGIEAYMMVVRSLRSYQCAPYGTGYQTTSQDTIPMRPCTSPINDGKMTTPQAGFHSTLFESVDLLVPEQKWVDGAGEEEDTRQVDRRSGEDGHYRSDRDRLLRVCQVAGAVRARHNSCQVQREGRSLGWLA